LHKSLELFTSLFGDVPNLAILHINNGVDFLNPVIENVVNQSDGKLDYTDFSSEHALKVRMVPRTYEYVILSDILDFCENKIQLLKMYYTALENSANIIILTKKSSNSVEEIKNLLEETQFRAINDIDIFDEYIIVTAKKMHMWGNGL